MKSRIALYAAGDFVAKTDGDGADDDDDDAEESVGDGGDDVGC